MLFLRGHFRLALVPALALLTIVCAREFPDSELMNLLLLPEETVATATAASTTTPSVSSVTPTDGSSQLSVLGEVIRVTFSEEMDASTVTAQSSSGTCSGSIQLTADDFATCVGGTLASTDNIVWTFTPSITDPTAGLSAKILVTTDARSANNVALSSAWSSDTGITLFSPKDFSGLVLWLQADSLTGMTDGQAITSWTDSSGQGNTASQNIAGDKPLFRNAGAAPVVPPNGKAWIQFPGSNQHFFLSEFMTSAEPSMFIVGFSGGGASEWFFGDYGSSINSLFALRSLGNIPDPIVRDSAGVSISYAGGAAVLSNFAIMAIRISSTGSDIYTNGTLISNPALGSYAATTWEGTPAGTYLPRIGRHPDSGSAAEILNGGIAEMIFYNRSVSDTERARIECYLSRKYSIAGPSC